MRLGIISTASIPTPPNGYGGIEYLVWMLAKSLATKGYRIRLYGSLGSHASDVDGSVIDIAKGGSEDELASLASKDRRNGETSFVLDWSHTKRYSEISDDDMLLSYAFWTDAKGRNTVYPSKAVAAAFGEPNGQIIYPGIDIDKYQLRTDREDWFLYLGRIIPEKSVERSIAIAKSANVRLLVAGHVGAFSYDKNYIDMIKSMCTGKIEWVGEVDTRQKIELLSHAKGLIFSPKWIESFCIVVTEALASGCPCILGGVGGHMEQIEHGISGYKFSSMDEAVWAVRNVESISPIKCRERAEYFRASRMADDWEKLIIRTEIQRVK